MMLLLVAYPWTAWLANVLEEGRVVSGTSGAMSDSQEVVWECSKTAPQPLFRMAPTHSIPQKQGTCGTTTSASKTELMTMCSSAERGAWPLGYSTTPPPNPKPPRIFNSAKALRACANLCAACSGCNYFSFSTKHQDCSWFRACDVHTLDTNVDGFVTVDMRDVQTKERELHAALNETRRTAPRHDQAAMQMIEAHRRTLKKGTDSAFVQVGRNDMKTLHHMVATTGAVTSGETGFASGVSALAIMSALRHGGRHVAVDPFQGAYHYDGLRAANGYVASTAAKKALTFRHINETASMAVAWLHTQRVCFDAFFIDDGHKFDDIIVELFHVAKMLSFGGALMLHDNWMPSVQKVQGFIDANMPSLLHVPNPLGFGCCITIYTKVQTDQRAWDHFHPF